MALGLIWQTDTPLGWHGNLLGNLAPDFFLKLVVQAWIEWAMLGSGSVQPAREELHKYSENLVGGTWTLHLLVDIW